MRNAVKERCGYMMFMLVMMFLIMHSYLADVREPLALEADQEKIRAIHMADVEENLVMTESRPPEENEYVVNLDTKIEEELEQNEF